MIKMEPQKPWIAEIVEAFRTLGGAARYSDLYEYISRTTKRELTAQWKATIRRTVEDHSSDSKNFRAQDLFQHLSHGFWSLRDAGDVREIAAARENKKPRTVVDEALEQNLQAHGSGMVYVREHWRQWPSSTSGELEAFSLEKSALRIVAAWVADVYFELKFAKGFTIKIPFELYPTLVSANRQQLTNFEVGEYGIYWPLLSLQILIPEILSSNNSPKSNK